MALPTFFVMLRGTQKELHSFLIGLLPQVEIVWAAVGEFMFDAPWQYPPKGFKVWNFHMGVKVSDRSVLTRTLAATNLQSFVLEVEPKSYAAPKFHMEDSKIVLPANEPAGIAEVFRRNRWQIFLSPGLVFRIVLRMVRIVYWLAYFGILKGMLWRPFHQLNLMTFSPDKKAYEMYRDAASKLVVGNGGGLAFLADVKKKPGEMCFDEVMVVAYKNRFQFIKMALLTPSFWPLSMLRDEGLSDSMLHATDPLQL